MKQTPEQSNQYLKKFIRERRRELEQDQALVPSREETAKRNGKLMAEKHPIPVEKNQIDRLQN